MLNLEQVKMLFVKEAVVFSGNNGVPLYRATELFGEEAAQFAARKKPIINGSMRIIYSSRFGVGDYEVEFLTYYGFLQAATYANVLEIKKMEREKVEENGQAD